ncbi:hypothetical protein RD792_000954 [Penstemon davidsonii]|uniref:B box-type domain-containing protein n=1 Tax=Penstemon davidsonii TaxID=160366 RepID=A0ABR0DNA1_9LAMI|nr:hypothetical protein RD792_000954 [Penstemon davidsonii]
MKIQCDVCNKDEASVFCLADEAAICAACDHRVHHANKLAGKHQRFSLHHPLPKQAPICDICQERRAFLFCQQDRAILCEECDNSIHKANEHTQKHSRFLLTGVKLSSTSTLYSPSPYTVQESASSSSNNGTNPTAKSTTTTIPTVVQRADVAAPESCDKINNPQLQTSSISEYLIDMLPGWHVEDILDSSPSPSPNYGFSKNAENDASWFWDAGVESNVNNVFPIVEKMGIWVPQVSPCLNLTKNQSVDISFGATTNGFCNNTNNSIKSSRKWSEDNSFAVPQIRPASSSFKRPRNLW